MHIPGLTTTLRLAARGPAPAREVWERYADVERWREWSPQIRRVDLGDALRIAEGVHGKVWSYAPVPVTVAITAVEEKQRRWSWRASVGPVHLDLDHGVDAGAAGTTTWLKLTGPVPIVLGYAPVAQLALRRLVR